MPDGPIRRYFVCVGGGWVSMCVYVGAGVVYLFSCIY